MCGTFQPQITKPSGKNFLSTAVNSFKNKMGQLKKFEFLSLGIKTPREKLHIYYCFLNFSCVYYIVIKICKHFTYKEFFFIRRKKNPNHHFKGYSVII